MNILFLTDNFPPEVNAPSSRTFEHAREWVRSGHSVTVVTCAPNFPEGRLFAGYKNALYATEVMEGIKVVRVWSYISANQGFLKRSLDYASFMVSATLASPWTGRADIVVATSPQFFTVVAGYIVSRLRRRPFVFELRDLWPESIKVVGAMNDGRALRTLERLELFLYRRAARIISVTNAFKADLISRGIDGGKIDVVTNGADLSRFSPMAKDAELLKSLHLERTFIAGYVGTHGMAHALDTLLDAAALLKARGNHTARILLLGSGAQKATLKERAATDGLDNVVFIDTVPKHEVARYWSLLDASIIHLKKTPLFTTVIPSKLFECMAMGIPVIHGVAGESAEIVRRTGCGLEVEPQNAVAIADAIETLQNDPAQRALLAAAGTAGAREYERSKLAERMLSLLRQTAEDGGKLRERSR